MFHDGASISQLIVEFAGRKLFASHQQSTERKQFGLFFYFS